MIYADVYIAVFCNKQDLQSKYSTSIDLHLYGQMDWLMSHLIDCLTVPGNMILYVCILIDVWQFICIPYMCFLSHIVNELMLKVVKEYAWYEF